MTQPVRSPINPYLAVDGARKALKFYKQAFAAEESELYEHEGRVGHATLTINGGHIYLSDVFPEMGDGMARAPVEYTEPALQ